MDATPEQLKELFHWPSTLISTVVPGPVRQAGWTHESTEEVLALLKDNHQRWHIFFNEKQFHNHAVHHLLAIYAMGASPPLLKGAYQTHVVYQKPAFPSPETDEPIRKRDKLLVDKSNWKDYLGDERYYQAFVNFLSSELLSRGSNAIQSVLEDYVFSKDANLVPNKHGKNPLMLSRFLAGFLHPQIHAGYGAEFHLPGLISEGVAEAAAQPSEADSLFTPEWFGWSGSSIAGLTSSLSSLVVSKEPAKDVHALSILGRISKDPAFRPSALGLGSSAMGEGNVVDRVVERGGKKLLEYITEWTNTVSADPKVIKKKFEELVWMNTTAYAVGGWAGREEGDDEHKKFNADFFAMHGVTSALMMPSLLNILTHQSAALLLRTYFAFSLVVYLARGRAPLPIEDFYRNTTATPAPPTPAPEPAKDTLATHAAPNPWLPIVQTTLVHPNEHLCKLQRALWHFADLYGGTPPRAFSELGHNLDKLDGTVFVRAAGLTADRLGWMREGQEQKGWDHKGFFKVGEKEE